MRACVYLKQVNASNDIYLLFLKNQVKLSYAGYTICVSTQNRINWLLFLHEGKKCVLKGKILHD